MVDIAGRGAMWMPRRAGGWQFGTLWAGRRCSVSAHVLVPVVLTDVLEDFPVLDPRGGGARGDRPANGPRRRVGSLIVDRRLVSQCLQPGPGDPLDKVQLFSCRITAGNPLLLVEADRVDDQRVALP